MPNFNTHWLVAIRLIQDNPATVPSYITRGYKAYLKILNNLSADVTDGIAKIRSPSDVDNFKTTVVGLITATDNKISNSLRYDDITCFSAYMLGACGPDFWMLPSEAPVSPKPAMAAVHFDLGHYNRTHQQFKVALRRWRTSSDTLQQRVEQSYYFGMATHIAADLVIHQLVNVSAGAYHLLEKIFENEQGNNTLNIWNTHNKVEHYWDSYIRYRYLGDYGPVFPKKGLSDGKSSDDADTLMGPLGAPTADKALRQIDAIISCVGQAEADTNAALSRLGRSWPWSERNPRREELTETVKRLRNKQKALKKAKDWLQTEANVFSLERFLSLPRIVCDRILSTDTTLTPFIYDVAVDKEWGAYPSDDIFQAAIDEAESGQMKTKGVFSEKNKLRFFSTELIGGSKFYSNNYLTYYACPNLDKVKQYANNVFFDLGALRNFIESAVGVANKFVSDLRSACSECDDSTGTPHIGSLANFWNLDTGLGLRIERGYSGTAKEVITSLNFIHITDYLHGVPLACIKNRDYLSGTDLDYENPDGGKGSFTAAFPTYPPNQMPEKLTDIKEDDPKQYLSRLCVWDEQDASSTAFTIRNFFKKKDSSEQNTPPQLAPSKNTKAKTTLSLAHIKTRLTLQVDTSIIALGLDDDVAFYLHSDSANGIDGSVNQGKKKEAPITDWYNEHKDNCLDFICTKNDVNTDRLTEDNWRRRFRSYVLLNLEEEKKATRQLGGKSGPWNNVIKYDEHKQYYGRNFVLATGRNDVLKPVGSGNFMTETNFDYFRNPSPTEQIFFTLFILVRNGDRVYDAISKAEVTADKLKELKKIDCLGFVKIVLFYAMTPGGAVQIDEAYVDGLKVPVVPASPIAHWIGYKNGQG